MTTDGASIVLQPEPGVFLKYKDTGESLLTVGMFKEFLEVLRVPNNAVIAYGGCGTHTIIVEEGAMPS